MSALGRRETLFTFSTELDVYVTKAVELYECPSHSLRDDEATNNED